MKHNISLWQKLRTRNCCLSGKHFLVNLCNYCMLSWKGRCAVDTLMALHNQLICRGQKIWWWCLFPHLWGFGDNVQPFIPHLRFCFLKWRLACTLMPLFRPGSVHIGSASCDDCDQVFPDKLRVSLFPDRFPHYAWTAAESAHSDFTGQRSLRV